jgi:ribosomal protein L31
MHPDSENPAFLKAYANREYNYQRCQSCHKPSYEQYLEGAHAKALMKQQTDSAAESHKLPKSKKAPTCGNCHSGHYTRAHLSRVEIGRQMVSVCGTCHPAQAATYLDNYHGKAAVNLGDKNAAFCTDCHGAHHCFSLKDKKTALAACQRCHPEATEGFAQVVIHPTIQDLPENDTEKRAHVALIRVVTLLMAIMVILVVGFFYGHSFVWILRELHEKLRKHK